ncbi:phenylalanine--tRNA ligase subunit beta [Staphylococcus aureus]|jgi:phenylalanyl-tRNA synthetase beta subunit (EC 6.1.1.20)|uniref:Phenylalanine--tRNA ligase beta subunit n=2 Tax=Staphylococcus aureus TaxID=1280 RepID=A0AAN1ZNN1_STAAU|nr:phenylalanine--tRNA ligase subunit beta [Staphylococcus aureus]MRF34323.1 phenylalanine--tRNA ligase subunit beta [Staphylococcus sp. KY49P]HAR4209022.1 phenylalanine--tRNA ligase subunit beta [Staphylococcus aureus ADL-210]HAR4233351.1 phenylalanine--tRNA ligase subunit beta [Staphylococcus aureus ADL-206]ANI74027.1 phenylalanine--tRNA ligase subunit beta [Staphylococcus aureus]EES93293.1 phenylalanine--tRNA ligase, beta subunit [Staphylococcus aureus subsp. aureus USA300_TCH959]
MLISNEWLKEYVTIDDSVSNLAERITRTGIEVDDLIDYTKDIKNLVVGFVKSKEKHPDADKLNVCQVDIGEDEPVQIVCGAPNVDAGQYVIVAKVGGRLPGGIKIKRAKLRGERSEGMICSLQEIGISSNYIPKSFESGIYVFSEAQVPGTDALQALYLDDQVMEFDLTPNRADALSMIGTAYEVAALYNTKMTKPETTSNELDLSANDELTVTIENEDKVPYYSARVVHDVTIEPSPIWMQAHLIKAGIRPINNVVDISNYVLLEYGQPLHMFDQDAIGSQQIVVRQANEGEKMTTLDDTERELLTSDIVITNGQTPIALAGVMGGDFSEVKEQTSNIVIEGAIFDPVSIRHTSRRLNLRSESSSRFEKGIATEFVDEAVDRACYLLQTYANGKVLKDRVSSGELGAFITPIDITADKINRTIGFDLSQNDIVTIFNQLGFDTEINDDVITVLVPSRRKDITIKEDLIEEVARIYGYDDIPSTLPVFDKVTSGQLTDRQYKTRMVKEVLEGAGLDQAITYSLVSKEDATAFSMQQRQTIDLLMPMSEAHASLRQSLLPHLIEAASYNVARKNKDVKLFEIGNVFFANGEGELPDQVEYLSGILTGDYVVNQWQGKKETVDFYLAKGVVDRVSEKLNLEFSYRRADIDGLHPGRTAEILLENKVVGFIGELHPILAADNDLKRTYVFELNFDALMAVSVGYINYQPIPRFPGMSRDIALEVDQNIPAADLLSTIHAHGGNILKDTLVFDVYQGEHLEKGKKSIAIRLNYLDTEETLTDERVSKVQAEIEAALIEQGAVIR